MLTRRVSEANASERQRGHAELTRSLTDLKDLANLLSTNRRAFDSIASLTVPDLCPFENAKMRESFGKITRELRK